MKGERFIRLVASSPSKRDTGRGFQETIYHDETVYFDVYEVEMTVKRAFQYKVMMKSGRELIVSEEDFNKVEAAIKEREL